MNIPISDLASILEGDPKVIDEYRGKLATKCPCCGDYFFPHKIHQKYCSTCFKTTWESRKAIIDAPYRNYRREQKRLWAQYSYGNITREQLDEFRAAAKSAYEEKHAPLKEATKKP